jgi:hypothetical protein
MTFTVALYRQVAIGISKKHLYNRPHLTKAGPQESASDGAVHKLFAWQAGHSVAQEMESYGLDGDFPTRLQPLLFDLYQTVSLAWHQWLGLDTEQPGVARALDSQPSRARPGTQQDGHQGSTLLEPRPTAPLYSASTPAPRGRGKRKQAPTPDWSSSGDDTSTDRCRSERDASAALPSPNKRPSQAKDDCKQQVFSQGLGSGQGTDLQRSGPGSIAKRQRIGYEQRWIGRDVIVLIKQRRI